MAFPAGAERRRCGAGQHRSAV
ncbi:hypothetical protein ACGFZ3_13135 [Stenotrophomonas sp. NPDC047960]